MRRPWDAEQTGDNRIIAPSQPRALHVETYEWPCPRTTSHTPEKDSRALTDWSVCVRLERSAYFFSEQ
jgi:hypothetical protein